MLQQRATNPWRGDLKKFIDPRYIKRWTKMGKDSGYPACCIAMFIGRSFMLTTYASIRGHMRPFSGAPENNRQHVVCPYHKRKIKEYVYHTCKICKWQQYNDPDCKNCAQDDYYKRLK